MICLLNFQVFEYEYVWWKAFPRGEGHKPLEPYLLSCLVPKSHWDKTPSSVAIVKGKCGTRVSNNLKVIYQPPHKGPKKDFAVCVKVGLLCQG